MAISSCEICSKPYNSALGKICSACARSLDETYVTVRRYMYQNPKNCDYINIIEDTGVSEKELNYLIKKGRIEVANKPGGAAKCRACGKETSGSSICEHCMTKILAEKIAAKRDPEPNESKDAKKDKPEKTVRSFHKFLDDR